MDAGRLVGRVRQLQLVERVLEALLVEQGTFVEYGERIAVLRAA